MEVVSSCMTRTSYLTKVVCTVRILVCFYLVSRTVVSMSLLPPPSVSTTSQVNQAQQRIFLARTAKLNPSSTVVLLVRGVIEFKYVLVLYGSWLVTPSRIDTVQSMLGHALWLSIVSDLVQNLNLGYCAMSQSSLDVLEICLDPFAIKRLQPICIGLCSICTVRSCLVLQFSSPIETWQSVATNIGIDASIWDNCHRAPYVTVFWSVWSIVNTFFGLH